MSRPPVPTALSRGPCPAIPELAARYLEEYLEKIRFVVEPLDDEQVWWRPAAGCNSIGNLLLHLVGNLTMWIAQGLGGDAYERDRRGEFAADRTHTGDQLLAMLAAVVGRCRQVLDALEGEALERPVDVQTYRSDALGVVFHAVEHMSYHTGQVLYLVKQLRGAGQGIELYPQHREE